MNEKDNLQDIDKDGGIVLKCIFKKWDGNVNWIYLAQVRDRWRTL